MNVTLSPELVEKMDKQVESGTFKNRDEILDAAVKLVLLFKERQEKTADLQAAVDEGEADIAAGRFTRITNDKELDDFFAAL